jgi:hypothetical protein
LGVQGGGTPFQYFFWQLNRKGANKKTEIFYELWLGWREVRKMKKQKYFMNYGLGGVKSEK